MNRTCGRAINTHEFIDVDDDRPAQPNPVPPMPPSNLAPLHRYPQPPSGSSMQGQATWLPPSTDVPHYSDAPYGQAGSVSAPDRSPGLSNHPQFQATNRRLSEGLRALPGPQDYESRSSYCQTDHQPNETQTSDVD